MSLSTLITRILGRPGQAARAERGFDTGGERQWISNPYHAVSIVAAPGACNAVRQLSGRRFLSEEAPSPPLPGCNAALCKCGYRHHDDRRAADRRAGPRGPIGEERRRSPGRRSTDVT